MTFAAVAGTRRHLGSTIGALAFVPVAFFGMPLGPLALGNAWRAAGNLWQQPLQVGETIMVAGVGVWIVLLGLTVARPRSNIPRTTALSDLNNLRFNQIPVGPRTGDLVRLPLASPIRS